MFDRQMLTLTKPLVDAVAVHLHRFGLTANQISLTGFVFGMVAAIGIAFGFFTLALIPLLINRLLDGLDGAVARHSTTTDRGAFIDISLDFLFYAAVPLGFAMSNPGDNALAAALLLASFIGTGTSFMAYAIIAEKRGVKSTAYPTKGFYYLGGLTEGFETVLCFLSMCIWPQYFAVLAFTYATLCGVTTLTRIIAGWQSFGRANP